MSFVSATRISCARGAVAAVFSEFTRGNLLYLTLSGTLPAAARTCSARAFEGVRLQCGIVLA
eukprot:2379098-Prymnesium_polylepis.1